MYYIHISTPVCCLNIKIKTVDIKTCCHDGFIQTLTVHGISDEL